MTAHRLLPWAAATLAFVLVLLVGAVVMGRMHALGILERNDDNARFAQEVLSESSAFLLSLVHTQAASCDTRSLREMRERIYNSNFVYDVAVLDADNRPVCSTTLDRLASPLPAMRPDYEVVLHGLRLEVSDFEPPRYIDAQGRLFAVVREASSRFQISLSPHAISKMRSTQYAAVGTVRPDGSLHVVRGTLRDQAHSPDLLESWSRSMDWTKSVRRFDWPHLQFESVYRLNAVPFVYYSRAPLVSGGSLSRGGVAATLVAGGIVALLVHAVVRHRVALRCSMGYRIKALLKPANVRCMYQPIVRLATGQVVGCEVLVRLLDGPRLLTPDQFLPAVVDGHLTWVLDETVIRNSVQDLQACRPADSPFKVAVNLFPENVQAHRLHALLHEALGLDLRGRVVINFEVVEQHYQDSILEQIALLKQLGYQVSVDDFGTGYSNLGSVRKMQPHYLKIDRSFVHEMELATVRSSLIPEIVAIGRATGAQIVAEGIEKEEQRTALDAIGVEFGQGYLFGRPMPIAAFLDHVAEQRHEAPAPDAVVGGDASPAPQCVSPVASTLR